MLLQADNPAVRIDFRLESVLLCGFLFIQISSVMFWK